MKRTFSTIAMIMILSLAMPAGAAETTTTVGSFVERLAQAKNLESPSPRAALAALRVNGIRLPTDLLLTDTLTEGHVAQISRALGVDVSTNPPDSVFYADQVNQFFKAYKVEAALRGEPTAPAVGSTTPSFDPYVKGKGRGKGKKKGNAFTPSEPE
jgi:hypothetical protein